VRLRLEVEHGPALVALFARYLTTIEAAREQGTGKTAYPTLSVRGRLKMNPAVNCGIAAIYSGKVDADNGVSLDTATRRITAIGTLTFEFAKDSALTLEERYIWNRVDEPTATDRDYEVSMLSLYVRAGIW
jgi:hypothetical protein